MSEYNDFHERLLGADLLVGEWRLAVAILRSTLGFYRRSNSVGEDRLRALSGLLDGRSFKRARDGLIRKGLIAYDPPERSGRGRRGTYTLLFGDETPASERDIASETPAESPAQTPAGTPAGSPALERARIEEGGESKEERSSAYAANGANAPVRAVSALEPEDLEALTQLVESLEDADSKTLAVFARDFGGALGADDYDKALDVLEARRRQASSGQKEPLRTEAGFVHGVLSKYVELYGYWNSW